MDSLAEQFEVAESRPRGTDEPFRALVGQVRALVTGSARKEALAVVDQAAVSGANFLTAVLVGRIGGEDELGAYALGFTIIMAVSSVIDSFVSEPYMVYGNRLQGKDRAEFAGSVLVHCVGLCLLSVLGLALATFAIRNNIGMAPFLRVMGALTAVIPFLLLRQVGRDVAYAHLRVGSALALDSAAAALQVLGLFALAGCGMLSAATAYLAIGTAAALASAGWFYAMRHTFARPGGRVRSDLSQNWRLGRWVLASSLVSIFQGSGMRWLLAIGLTVAAAGKLSACETVVGLANPFLLAMGLVVPPRACQALAREGVRSMRHVVWRGTWAMGLVVGAFCVLLSSFGGTAVTLLFGQGFAGNGHTVAVLAVGLLAMALSIPIGGGLRAMARPDLNFWVGMLGLLVTFGVTSCLMFSWGVLGAAYGLLAGSTLSLAVRAITFLALTVSEEAHTKGAEPGRQRPAPGTAVVRSAHAQ